MKEMIPAFDYPFASDTNPTPHAPIYYGNQYVPHPTNSAAKQVDAAKIMNQTNHAK